MFDQIIRIVSLVRWKQCVHKKRIRSDGQVSRAHPGRSRSGKPRRGGRSRGQQLCRIPSTKPALLLRVSARPPNPPAASASPWSAPRHWHAQPSADILVLSASPRSRCRWAAGSAARTGRAIHHRHRQAAACSWQSFPWLLNVAAIAICSCVLLIPFNGYG